MARLLLLAVTNRGLNFEACLGRSSCPTSQQNPRAAMQLELASARAVAVSSTPRPGAGSSGFLLEIRQTQSGLGDHPQTAELMLCPPVTATRPWP